MERIKEYITGWTVGREPAELAAVTVCAIVIAVVPGALTLWLAWRVLRTWKSAYLRP